MAQMTYRLMYLILLLLSIVTISYGFLPHKNGQKMKINEIKKCKVYNKMNRLQLMMAATDNDAKLDRNRAKRSADVLIESPTMNSRRISANMIIDGSLDDVWDILSDYDNLATHIPNLVKSNLVSSPEPGGIRLFQEGAQKIVGFDFRASLTMDMTEVYSEEDLAMKERKIKFKHVESFMFSSFDGDWTLKLYSRSKVADPITRQLSYQYKTQLSYSVLVKPRGPVPVLALEWRIREDVPLNLLAVKIAAEKLSLSRKNRPPGSDNDISAASTKSNNVPWANDETLGAYIGVGVGAGNTDNGKKIPVKKEGRGKVFRDAWGRALGGSSSMEKTSGFANIFGF